MNVLIADTLAPDFEDPNHPVKVRNAFLIAYPDFTGSFFFTTDSAQAMFDYAVANDCSLIIRSTIGLTSYINLARTYYNSDLIQLFMPAGSNAFPPVQVYNSAGNLPNISVVVTGAGDVDNETGYDIKYYAPDPIDIEPDASSFSNGYIAGWFVYMAVTLGITDWWIIEYLLRLALGNSWTAQNGYGYITRSIIQSAINLYDSNFDYNSINPYINHIGTVGTITGLRLYPNVHLAFAAIDNAESYELQRNDNREWEDVDISELTYTDTITKTTSYRYRGIMTNVYGDIEYSDWSDVLVIKYPKVNVLLIKQ